MENSEHEASIDLSELTNFTKDTNSVYESNNIPLVGVAEDSNTDKKENNEIENSIENSLDKEEEEQEKTKEIEKKETQAESEPKKKDMELLEDKMPRIQNGAKNKKDSIVGNKEEEEDNQKKAIEQLSIEYGVSKEEALFIVARYETIESQIIKLGKKEVNQEDLKEAIKQKHENDEDMFMENLISNLLQNISNDIENDSFLESINKETVYKKNFLVHIKKRILDNLNKYERYTHEREYEELEKVDNDDVNKAFLDKYNVKIFELDSNSLIRVLLQEDSFDKFLTIQSMFYSDLKIKRNIGELKKEMKKAKLSMDKIFLL